MSRTDVFRNGKVHVQKHQCSTCIFRPGNLMRLEEGRVEQMVHDAIRDDGCIPCHKHLDGPGQAVCRGFFDNHHGDSKALLLARQMGIIEEIVLREK